MNNYELDLIAKDYAAAIAEELEQHDGDAYDLAHEYVDGSEHVIYYAKAHAICQNCNIENGLAFLEDVGIPKNISYNGHAVLIAYGELHARVIAEYEKLTTLAA